VKNHLWLAAKVSKEINNIPTCGIFFLPYLACISADYAFLKNWIVKVMSPFFQPEQRTKILRLKPFFYHIFTALS
jgi:hypothetical protein